MAGLPLTLGLVAALVAVASAGPIWMIHIGNEWGAHEYFDGKGYLKGFGIGMIDLVCTSGNMDCRIVWDKYDNCFNHHEAGERPSGGRGLMGGWYDGCIGWVPTIERIHTMDFTIPYIKQRFSYFYVLKGQDGSFNPKDVRGKKIAFLDGWATNEQCLARQDDKIQGAIIKPDQIVRVAQASDAIQALRDGRADAMFGSGDNWIKAQEDMLHRYTDPEISCTLAGWGLMARKDSGVIPAWNVGFTKLQQGNKFNKYCEEANAEHQDYGKVDCITQ